MFIELSVNICCTPLSDPDNGCAFEVWYNRYEDVISKDGATLDDATKALLIKQSPNSTPSHMPVSRTTFFLKEHGMFP
ncbi:hypothetical protein RB195_010195 [Necator americanus]|uniref:DUF7083 domain-containing protein n=1 Tax=Necator americanus TaxID=51031 RepID=A0ABR1CXL6_NECAM